MVLYPFKLLKRLRPRTVALALLWLALAPPAEALERHPFRPYWDCANLLKAKTPVELARLESYRLAENAPFSQITQQWKKLRQELWEDFTYVDASIDARRLINVGDWEDALRDMPDSPWFKYGKEPIANFYAVTFIVRKDAAGLDIDGTILQFLHSWAMRGLPFHGFEGRRLLNQYRSGTITHVELKALLKRAYEGNEEIAGVRHNDLIGKFRDDPLDDIEHRGSSLDENKNRYFTAEELAALRKNRYLRVDEASIKPRPQGGFTGVVHYYPPKNIEEVVEAEIAGKMKIIESAYAAGRLADMIAATTELERNLISIHPFLDGNGRSIRAMIDVIYLRHHLPVPMNPNESDLLFSTAESIEYTRKEMIRSMNAWIDSAKGGVH